MNNSFYYYETISCNNNGKAKNKDFFHPQVKHSFQDTVIGSRIP